MRAYSFAFILRRERRHLSLGKQGISSYRSFNVLCKFQQKTSFTKMKTGGHKKKETVESKNDKFSDYPKPWCIFAFMAIDLPGTGQQTLCYWALQMHIYITMIGSAHPSKSSIKKEAVRQSFLSFFFKFSYRCCSPSRTVICELSFKVCKGIQKLLTYRVTPKLDVYMSVSE